MDVLVAYESRRGWARRAADAVADAAASHGVATLIRRIDQISPDHLAAADALVAGCWTPGKVPFGDRPTRRMTAWIERLPPLDGKPVGLFCTYRFFPHTFADTTTRAAETLHELSSRFEMKGATVAATRSIHFKAIEESATDLIDRVLAQTPSD